jgi:tetratricopeptide (TPR) repeat protein
LTELVVHADRFSRLREIAIEAAALEGTERDRYLDRACAGDVGLRREVETLLAGDGSAVGRVDDLVERLGTAVRSPATSPGSIGPYRVLSVLGEGGMGIVYHAEQQEPIRREVALKLVRGSLDSPGARARLEAERQTLARLSHPNIAHVLDAGADADGRPYFVMERVQGDPITDYCRSVGLDGRRKVRLFLDVARALAHSHRRGVIHRDLKPSNVLVSGEPERPVVKVIDFGVAKILEEHALATDYRTRPGQIVGTLHYMSPEQARGETGEIDTRTDVWALGTILYQLLADRLPLDLQDMPLAESLRRIEHEPPRPLRRGSGSSTTTRIDADLETIVSKCLEKEPDRRYGSAAELAEDLERYLDSRPILAHPPSAGYQARMLVRRHRGLIAALLALSIALAAGAAGTLIGLLRAREQAQTARTQAAIAEAVSRFLHEDLLTPEAIREEGIDVRLRKVLEEASQRIDGRFPDQPLVEAEVRSTLGMTYAELGEYLEAERHLRRVLDMRRELLGDRDPATLETLNDLGWMLQLLGHYDEAHGLLREAYEGRREVLGPENRDTPRSLNNYAVIQWRHGNHAAAERLHRESLSLKRRLLGEEHTETVASKSNLAIVLATQGRLDEAEPLFVEVVETRRRLGEQAATLRAMQNLAKLYGVTGRADKAEALFRDVIEASRRHRGDEHPRTLSARAELAEFYGQSGRFDQAESILRAVFEARRQVLGSEAAETWQTMYRLGQLHERAGRLDEAERCYLEAAEAQRVTLGEGHSDRFLTLESLAELYARSDRPEEAATRLRELLEALRTAYGWDRPWTYRTAERLAAVLLELGDRDHDAVALLRQALDRRRRRLGDRHEDTLETRFQLARALTRSDHKRSLEELGELNDRGWADGRLLDDGRFAGLSGDAAFEAIVAQVRLRLELSPVAADAR